MSRETNTVNNSQEEDTILVQNRDKKVKITSSKYGTDLYTMRNGWKWTGLNVDDELLEMIRDAIGEYFKDKGVSK